MNETGTQTLNLDFQLCRICLEESKDCVNLFSGQENSIDILRKIYNCFHKTVVLKAHLPKAICRTCIEELDVCDRFRLKCETFEERFRNFCEAHFTDVQVESESKHNINLPCRADNCDGISDSSPIQGEILLEHSYESKQKNIKAENGTSEACNSISMYKKGDSVGETTGIYSDKRFPCTKCKFSTPHKRSLIRHLKNHEGLRPYHCDCGKSFAQQSTLMKHKRMHIDATFHTCPTCGKQFKYDSSYRTHLEVHSKLGTFRCTICPKNLKSSQTLKQHMYRHFNIKKYTCEDCGDTFVCSSALMNHRKHKHVGERIKCHICEKYETNNKEKLEKHLLRHSGPKTYECEYCSKSYVKLSELKRHRRVHTKEKPYQCPMCIQRFTHSSSINKHMRTAHGVNYKYGEAKLLKQKMF